MIRLVLADDHSLLLDGLRAALETYASAPGSERFQVVGAARDGIEALAEIRAQMPDVAIIDLEMPRCDGLRVLRALAAEKNPTPVLIVTSFDNDATYAESLALGARGFLNKACGIDRLAEAIVALAEGRTFALSALSPRASEHSAGSTGAVTRHRDNPLTAREREILRFIATGLSNAEIATTLGTSEGTVKNQTSSILRKLDVRDRTRAVLVALKDGWI